MKCSSNNDDNNNNENKQTNENHENNDNANDCNNETSTNTLSQEEEEEAVVTLQMNRRQTIVTVNTSNPFDVYSERIVIVMVGLPARGKSYLSKAIVRYLNYLGCPTQLFNAGHVRRARNDPGLAQANFFDTTNAAAKALRDEMALQCLDQCLDYVSPQRRPTGCRVAILDATNTTQQRRHAVWQHVQQYNHQHASSLQVLFLESLVNDETLLEQNYRMKLTNGDYDQMDAAQALQDFRNRVAHYQAVYEPITDQEGIEKEQTDSASNGSPTTTTNNTTKPCFSYIQLYNAGEKMITRNVQGFVMRKIQRLMGSVHLNPRTIWLVLTAETENCAQGIIGGDPRLSEAGVAYAQAVADLIHAREERVHEEDHQEKLLTIYTGTRQAYRSVAQYVMMYAVEEATLLTLAIANDICAGSMDSMSIAEREAQYPVECEARRDDKLNYRYPGVGGESYVDLVSRVNELTCLLEQSSGNSVVICDRAVYRCIKAYFLGHSIQEIPFLDVEKGVLELRRNHSGFTGTQIPVHSGKCSGAVVGGKDVHEW